MAASRSRISTRPALALVYVCIRGGREAYGNHGEQNEASCRRFFRAVAGVYQGVGRGRAEGQASGEVRSNLEDLSICFVQTCCGLRTATWYVCSDSVITAIGIPTTQQNMYTMAHQEKFGKSPRMSAIRHETKVIIHASCVHNPRSVLTPCLGRTRGLTIAIEHVANAKGSPTRLLKLNLRPLPVLYLLFSILRSDGEVMDP